MADASDSQKKAVFLAVLMIGGLGYVGYNNVYKPQQEEIAQLEERLGRLEAQNRTARRLTAEEGRSEVERRLGFYREQLVQVEGLIPSSEELPDLLDAISTEAQRSGVELALIQPVGASAEQYYTRRTYELAVNGSYHEIASFLTEIASLRRIITPINLRVATRGNEQGVADGELQAKFAIETYVLPSEGLPTAGADPAAGNVQTSSSKESDSAPAKQKS